MTRACCEPCSGCCAAAGFQPHGFASAESFLNEREIGHLDCILCDLSLPGKSGLELFSHMRALSCSPALVLMTAFDQPDLPERAARCGAAACLLKPFQGTTLIETLSNVIAAARRGVG